MAASSFALSSQSAPAEFWNRFQTQALVCVSECNATAGENLWVARVSSDLVPRLTVESAADPRDRITCVFDPEEGVLMVTPGPAITAAGIRFRVEGQQADALRLGDCEFTICEALSLALGQLIWPEDNSEPSTGISE